MDRVPIGSGQIDGGGELEFAAKNSFFLKRLG